LDYHTNDNIEGENCEDADIESSKELPFDLVPLKLFLDVLGTVQTNVLLRNDIFMGVNLGADESCSFRILMSMSPSPSNPSISRCNSAFSAFDTGILAELGTEERRRR